MELNQLQYAPPIRKRSGIYVIPAGLATSALALGVVWALAQLKPPVNVMGWYANYVIPAGALLVGIVAGSGYGIASWVTGVRMERHLLIVVAVLQLSAYAIAKYLDFYGQHLVYQATGQPIGFLEYFHLTTINMAWIPQNSDTPGSPLGMWGYGLRLLEILGFCLGGLTVPAVLVKHPYCELCQVYMKTKQLASLPASVPFRKVKKSDVQGTAAYESEQQAAVTSGSASLDQLLAAANGGDVAAFRSGLEAAKPLKKKAEKLPRRIRLRLIFCRHCYSAHLAPSVVTGRGKKLRVTTLPTSPVSVDFARDFLRSS